MFSFTDTHAHLSMLPGRFMDPEGLLGSLFESGFGSILDVGTTSDDLAGRVKAFSKFPAIRFSAGIWPSAEAIRNREAELARLRASIDENGAGLLVAVGECGFDRYWNRPENGSDLGGELELFLGQAEIALDLDLPVIVHSREAPDETARALAIAAGIRGVIHCFSYGKDEARRFLDLGFHISLAGTVTYQNAQNLRVTALYVPDDRLLLETDTPYLAPLPFRGKSAEPGMIEKTYEMVASCRGTTVEKLAAIVARNARDLFALPTKF